MVGGSWTVKSYPDKVYPNEPTPEVITTNGNVTAAIEVKSLIGDPKHLAYDESLLSNEKFLIPSCGGYYVLYPPIDFRLPMDIKTRRHVKQEIERVAPTLQPGSSGAVRVPRQGHIALISESGPPYIYCLHHSASSEIMKPLFNRLSGQFMLVDEGLEHSFITDEGKAAFFDAVTTACQKRLEGDASAFIWHEEWRLEKTRGQGKKDDSMDGVWILACSGVFDVKETVTRCVEYVLENAMKKFAIKRWAELHLLVLEESALSNDQLVNEAISNLQRDDLQNVDFILAVHEDKVVQCYPFISERLA
jgi:hypothetical protein